MVINVSMLERYLVLTQQVKGVIDKMYKNRKTTGALVFVDISDSLPSLKDCLLQFSGMNFILCPY
jgi:hypothetical protein